MEAENQQISADSSNLTIILKGALMEDGAIESKVLLQVLDGTIGAIESMAQAVKFRGPLTFYLRPPDEGSFSIDLQTVQILAGAVVSIWPQTVGLKEIVSSLIEYIKIKLALQGEDLREENIQKNSNGDVSIRNKKGKVVYNDNRVNVNLILAASTSPTLNKEISQLAASLEKSTAADSLYFKATDTNTSLLLSKSEVEYLKYEEHYSHRSDSVTGYIRKIDNKTFNGTIVVLEDGKEKSVNFAVSIMDISKLEGVVNNLAIAEGNRARVQLIGEKQLDSTGQLKKVIVHDVVLPDGRLEL